MTSRGTLAARCRGDFTSRVVERGNEYFRRGRVTLEAAVLGPAAIAAAIRGSRIEPYRVQVRWDATAEVVVATCDCPIGMRLVQCKHLYAALLEADHVGGYEELFPGHTVFEVHVDPDSFGDPDDDGALDSSAAEPRLEVDGPVLPSSGRRRGRAAWRPMLDAVAAGARPLRYRNGDSRGSRRRLEYQLEPGYGELRVSLYWRNLLKGGGAGEARRAAISELELPMLEPADAEILAIARGCAEGDAPRSSYAYGGGYAYPNGPSPRTLDAFVVRPVLARELLPRLCKTGRFGAAAPAAVGREASTGPARGALSPLRWDDAAYALALVIEPGARPGALRLRGILRADDAEIALADVRAAYKGGIVMFDEHIALAVDQRGGDFDDAWLRQLWSSGPTDVPKRDVESFMEVLAESARVPELKIAPGVDWVLSQPAPRPLLRFFETRGKTTIGAQLWFLYDSEGRGTERVRWGSVASAACFPEARALVLRDREREQAASQALAGLGFVSPSSSVDRRYRDRGGADVGIAADQFAPVVRQLIDAGWQVEAEGKRLRAGFSPSIRVSSGVDWFELSVGSSVDEAALELPELLLAIKRRDGFVTLSDGSRGMLPEDWLDRYAPLAELGKMSADGNALTLTRGAGVLLDAMLAAHPEVDVDVGYAKFRRELERFDRVRPARAPRGFRGTLREYQALGLGWLKTLARFGLGGCLADDMGLGKTVQVLALIASKKKKSGPTLVVAPKSLIFNWLDEAERFTPGLRTASYIGAKRSEVAARFDELDLVVTTYGTARRDIRELSQQRFHYLVLDEASAIKNPTSQIAKACRLLSAEHRLALTGTPIENRLSDLASILEFLNPGMMHATAALESLAQPTVSEHELASLGRALKPLLLRRTKDQVLSELPDKTEQVLRCALGQKQRRLYDELRDHYRALLDKTIDKQGLARSKMHVLEALLRLRQAACHPGLLDPMKRAEPSAKLDALMEPLLEVVEAGHKALVFSQFTSFLSIARDRLDEAKVSYAYLDGKTRRRKDEVERFQNDPSCSAFLISLKAGGHGLNLTAAEYVFLLDPWWNPAVETQAIDRAHRIGQQRPVFAYRMIAEDTVEDRVLELQQHKRELAEGILAGQRSVLGALTVDDLSLLLS